MIKSAVFWPSKMPNPLHLHSCLGLSQATWRETLTSLEQDAFDLWPKSFSQGQNHAHRPYYLTGKHTQELNYKFGCCSPDLAHRTLQLEWESLGPHEVRRAVLYLLICLPRRALFSHPLQDVPPGSSSLPMPRMLT